MKCNYIIIKVQLNNYEVQLCLHKVPQLQSYLHMLLKCLQPTEDFDMSRTLMLSYHQ